MGSRCCKSADGLQSGPRKLSKAELQQRVRHARVTRTLNLRECKLRELPREVWDVAGELRQLDLTGNNLTELPDRIREFRSLQSLTLPGNRIEHLPPELSELTHLNRLDVSRNQLGSDVFSAVPTSVKQLDVSHNPIRDVPPAIGNLRNLTILNLSACELGPSFPKELLSVHSLEELFLDDNRLHRLDNVEDFSPLSSLSMLYIRRNALHGNSESLPPSLLRDTRIHKLQLDGNPMRKLQVQQLEGFPEFEERRKERIDRGLRAGVQPVDAQLCGLSD